MTPDLTTAQTIGLASAIVGFCLTVFFTTLIVLTYGHQIRQYLRRRGDAGPAQTPKRPLTYLSTMSSPFQRPEPARGQLADLAPIERQPATAGPVQRRPTTYVASSSEELLQNRGARPKERHPWTQQCSSPGRQRPKHTGQVHLDQRTSPPLPRTSSTASGLWYRTDLAPGWNIPVPSPYFSTTSSTTFPSDFADQPILIPDSDSDSSSDPRN